MVTGRAVKSLDLQATFRADGPYAATRRAQYRCWVRGGRRHARRAPRVKPA